MEQKGQIDKYTVSNIGHVLLNSPKNQYIFEKIKKIAVACYLVSDFLKDNEPLKWNIRDLSGKLVKDSMSFTKSGIEILHRDLISIISAIELGISANLISKMNGELIVLEINKLMIETREFDYQKDDKLSSSFFFVEKLVSNSLQKTDVSLQDMNYKGQDKGHSINNVLYDKYNSVMQNKELLKDSQKGTERKTRIMDILKSKGDVTIKDITSIIKDISEKTIQRDLNDLLYQGKIRRNGERRWSRYSII